MKVVAFDTETKGLAWFKPEEQAFLATWADADGEYCADLSDEAQVRQFRQAIDEADVVVCHNMPFDAHQTEATLGFDPLEGKVIHDTDIRSRVIYPEGQRAGSRGGHGLKNLAKVFLRADAGDPEEAIKEMAKAIGLRTIKQTGAYWEVWRAYPDVMEEYARQDARYTYDLYEKFSADAGPLEAVYDLEMTVMPVLIRAETRGTRTDQAALSRLKAQFEEQRSVTRQYLSRELGDSALGGEGSETRSTLTWSWTWAPRHSAARARLTPSLKHCWPSACRCTRRPTRASWRRTSSRWLSSRRTSRRSRHLRSTAAWSGSSAPTSVPLKGRRSFTLASGSAAHGPDA